MLLLVIKIGGDFFCFFNITFVHFYPLIYNCTSVGVEMSGEEAGFMF